MQGKWVHKPVGKTSVVFVHGILSSGEVCWRNSNGAYWPDLLQQQPGLSGLGIYVYTYQTGVFSGNYSISDIVDDLKERLFNLDKVITKQHQIIFVCHSLGGIVVRKLIVERILDFKKLNTAIGLFLVASPSLGSDYANYGKFLSALVGNAQAKVLGFSQKNNWLNDLDKEFRNHEKSAGLVIDGKELLEDKAIIFKKLFKKQIVEPFSAARYFGESYKVPGSDHSSIAKPENEEAIQHRLLVNFIKETSVDNLTTPIQMVKAATLQNQQISENSEKRQTINPGDSAEQTKAWQQNLTQRLSEQLKLDVLAPISITFADKLRQDCPDLSQDWESVASYLVKGQGDRHKQIMQFLNSAQQQALDISTKQPVENLMAYLLQILVRKCHDEEDKGLSRIPVDQIHSVKLVGATRTTVPQIPTILPIGHQEHENGLRNTDFMNIGHFLPETGEWLDPDKICQSIAYEILLSIGETRVTADDKALDKLATLLSAYEIDPENAPVHDLYTKHKSGHHPLQIDAVAARIRKILGDFLWIYIYGGEDSSQWLYIEESKIEGLISRYNRDIVKHTSTQRIPVQEDNKAATVQVNSVFISYS